MCAHVVIISYSLDLVNGSASIHMFKNALNKAANEGGELNLLEEEDEEGDEERCSEHGAEAHHYPMEK